MQNHGKKSLVTPFKVQLPNLDKFYEVNEITEDQEFEVKVPMKDLPSENSLQSVWIHQQDEIVAKVKLEHKP